jgi:hypothetical protein
VVRGVVRDEEDAMTTVAELIIELSQMPPGAEVRLIATYRSMDHGDDHDGMEVNVGGPLEVRDGGYSGKKVVEVRG